VSRGLARSRSELVVCLPAANDAVPDFDLDFATNIGLR
jgi:hypothetical protein